MKRVCICLFILVVTSFVCDSAKAQVADLRSSPIRIWLDLHDGGLNFSSKFVPSEGYRFKGSLSLGEWISLGRAFPNVEKDLLEFIGAYSNDANSNGFTADTIRIENACLAIGIIGKGDDISKALISLNDLGPKKGRVGVGLPRNVVKSLGIIADQSSVDFLVEIAESSDISDSFRENVIAALKGVFLENYSCLMDLNGKEVDDRRKRLSVGLEKLSLKFK